MCLIGANSHQWPDVGFGGCCWGSAANGPEYCTCWEPIYTKVQQPIIPEQEPGQRADMCVDCAFRPGSPERSGAPNYLNASEDELRELVEGESPFWCHQGMRKVKMYEHPCGEMVEAFDSEYRPPIKANIPFKANGEPGDICAGWSARHRLAQIRAYP